MASSSSSARKEGPIFFWREYDEPYGFLSQWYDCAFEHDGSTYRTAEEWMMVGKARLFGDEKVAEQMLQAITPKEHKTLGRKVKNFDDSTWNKNKYQIVLDGNYHKFTKSKESTKLRGKLLKTGDRELVEASPFDKIWGIGFSENKAEKNRHKWGKNLLGKALMEVRARIKEELANEEPANEEPVNEEPVNEEPEVAQLQVEDEEATEEQRGEKRQQPQQQREKRKKKNSE